MAFRKPGPCGACKGKGYLDCRVIDGTEGYVTCPFCAVERAERAARTAPNPAPHDGKQ